MHSQLYQSVRCEIAMALNAEPESNRSLIPDNVAEGGASKPVLIRNESGAVIGQRQRVYAVETRPRGSSTCPLHHDAFKHSKTVRAVNSLPGICHAMAMYCYSDKSTDWDLITCISHYAWSRMELFIDGWQKLKGCTLSDDKISKLRTLVLSALMHYREGVTNRKKLFTVQMLANQLKVSESNWRRDWGPFWNHYLNVLSGLDEQTLLNISKQAA